MELGRSLHLVPVAGLVLSGALALGGSPLLAAAPQAWSPEACGSGVAPPGRDSTWYRLDPVLDASGTLAAMRLRVGSAGSSGRSLALPEEAFASGPVQGRVITGTDDGSASLVRAIDPARGCATVIARVREAVVRSAVATSDGRAMYEHRVDRQSRADLGVWRRELAAWRTDGPARRVLDPLPVDARYGPTFTTGLLLDAEGGLVVSSCGEHACRVRVLRQDGSVRQVDGTGPALGATGGTVVTRAACTGFPCPVIAHDRGGSTRILAAGAWRAAMAGPTVVAETDGGALLAIDVATGAVAAAGDASLAPVDGGSLASSGAAAAPDEVVLAPGGRVSGAGDVRRIVPVVKEVAP